MGERDVVRDGEHEESVGENEVNAEDCEMRLGGERDYMMSEVSKVSMKGGRVR